MWDRKDLKAKGKAAFMANYLMSVIAGFLLVLCGGEGATFSSPSVKYNIPSNTGNEELPLNALQVDGQNIDINALLSDEEFMTVLSGVLGILLIAVAIGSVIGIILRIFLLNPAHVGLRRFFMDNLSEEKVSLSADNIGYVFKHNYGNVVKSMFTTDIFIFLWSLLLLIPGIYKSYCWRMVPFILSENDGLTGEQARILSAKMMDGQKMDAFILDLSFIGWYILGALTFGLLNLFWTNPYRLSTNAELYSVLSKDLPTFGQ